MTGMNSKSLGRYLDNHFTKIFVAGVVVLSGLIWNLSLDLKKLQGVVETSFGRFADAADKLDLVTQRFDRVLARMDGLTFTAVAVAIKPQKANGAWTAGFYFFRVSAPQTTVHRFKIQLKSDNDPAAAELVQELCVEGSGSRLFTELAALPGNEAQALEVPDYVARGCATNPSPSSETKLFDSWSKRYVPVDQSKISSITRGTWMEIVTELTKNRGHYEQP